MPRRDDVARAQWWLDWDGDPASIPDDVTARPTGDAPPAVPTGALPAPASWAIGAPGEYAADVPRDYSHAIFTVLRYGLIVLGVGVVLWLFTAHPAHVLLVLFLVWRIRAHGKRRTVKVRRRR